MAFIDDMRATGHSVESTCRMLTTHGCQVAARTCRSSMHPSRPIMTRTLTDATLTDALATRGTPEGLHRRRKVTHWLWRQCHEVAFCTLDQLDRDVTASAPNNC
jgi:putative transposase